MALEPCKRAVAVRSAGAAACKDLYARTVQLRRALVDIDEAFRIPRPVALDTKLGLLVVQWAWGKTLLEFLQTSDSREVMERVAVGLHSLHGAQVDGLPVVTVEDSLASADRCAKDIASVRPMLGPALESVMGALRRTVPADSGEAVAVIHNDFHWNQLRVKRNRMTLLDLERCAIGDPCIDVATFTTQISMLATRGDVQVSGAQAAQWRQAFLEAWESTTRVPVNVDRLQWYSVVALLTLARGMIRHLRPGWPMFVRHCVEHAVRLTQDQDAGHDLGGSVQELVT